MKDQGASKDNNAKNCKKEIINLNGLGLNCIGLVP